MYLRRTIIWVLGSLGLSLGYINIAQANQPDANSTSQKAEHFVAPLKRWAEDNVQNAELLQPSKPKTNRPKSAPALSLRQAINLARKQHQGTVLSAKYQAARKRYLIKIISAQGVVKTLVISASARNE